MKINTDSNHPYYWGQFFKNEPTLLLDGVPFEHDYVEEADDEAGTIKVAKMNGSHPIFAGGRYITETITGQVEIKGDLR